MDQSPFLITMVLVVTVSTHCYPIDCTATNSDSSSRIITMSKALKDLLVDVQKDTSNKGLYGVFLLADNLANDSLYAPQYQCLRRKACLGLMFTSNSLYYAACKNCSTSNLTYSELVNYYNELVLQLKLAEHNYHAAINVEIEKDYKDESFKREEKIIRLLNETILPALAFTLNMTRTDCSITKLLSDWMISLYSSCVSVQTSNKFLAETAKSLFTLIDNDTGVVVKNDDAKIAFSGRKEWCIAYTDFS